MNKTHIFNMKIPLYEVDIGGGVYHGNYYHLFELARESMFEDIRVTLDYCDRVERIEEEIDRLYQEFRQKFKELCKGMECPECILLLHTVDAIENIADRCEDTCDRVREFLVMKV